MKDTLIYRIPALRVPGTPVTYRNDAIPDSVGGGVLVEPEDPEDRKYKLLTWWDGVLSATKDPMMGAFTDLVGPALGQAEGKHIRVCPPWCLEIDLSVLEGRTRAVAWLTSEGDTSLTVDSDTEEIRALCWERVGTDPIK